MWRFGLLGIENLMQKWEYVEFDFDVLVQELGRVFEE